MKKREEQGLNRPKQRPVTTPVKETPARLHDLPGLMSGGGLSGEAAVRERLDRLAPAPGVDAVLALQRAVGNRDIRRAMEKSTQGTETAVSANLERSIEATRGGGKALDDGLRGSMEQAFGRDLSAVRVHTGGEADRLSRSLGAEAFTTGSDIYFRDGQYRPETEGGKELLAHELTHVAQQGPAVQGRLTVGAPDDAYERQADETARRVVRHDRQGPARYLRQPAAERLASGSRGIQRKLRFTGTAPHLARVMTLLNGGLFGYTVSTDAAGNLSIAANRDVGPPSEAQQALYNRLNTIVGDSHQVTIAVESGGAALGGSYATGTIDVADLEAFGRGEGLSAVAALIHEVEEQYRKQVSGQGYATAHAGALVAETEQSGATRGTERPISSSINPDGTVNAVIEVPYTYPDGRTVTLTITVSHNNITNVTRR